MQCLTVSGLCLMVNSVKYSLLYRVILKSAKHFKNSQQIEYATDHGNSYADREKTSSRFFKEKLVHIVSMIFRQDSHNERGSCVFQITK
jgi:hypothetical protein